MISLSFSCKTIFSRFSRDLPELSYKHLTQYWILYFRGWFCRGLSHHVDSFIFRVGTMGGFEFRKMVVQTLVLCKKYIVASDRITHAQTNKLEFIATPTTILLYHQRCDSRVKNAL